VEKTSRLQRAIHLALFILLLLGCLFLLGQMRTLLRDVWFVIQTVLTPLLIAMVIAYILNPIVELMVARKVPRGVSILIIYVFFIAVLLVLFMNTIPTLLSQLKDFGKTLPIIIAQLDYFIDQLTSKTKYLPNSVRIAVEKSLQMGELSTTKAISGLLNHVGHAISGLLDVFVVPFLVFYMLKDQKMLERATVALVPKKHRKIVVQMLHDIDDALGSYVRGQLLVMLVVGILTYAGLLVVHMPYALLFALIAAFTNIIPYLGPFIGAAPAIIVALTVTPLLALKVFIVNLIVQQLEGNVISPQIVGRTLHIHPMIIIVSLLFAGEVAGVAGLIVAVPIVAIAKVIGERLLVTRNH